MKKRMKKGMLRRRGDWSSDRTSPRAADIDSRLKVIHWGILLFAAAIILRLFFLQVVQGGLYTAIASGQYKLYEELVPVRGDILVHDFKDGKLYPVATNVDLGFLFADPRHVEDPDEAAEIIGEILGYDDEQIEALEEKLEKDDDPYEPIQRRVREELLRKIDDENLAGISYIRESIRTYPEEGLGGQLFGFVGPDDNDVLSGRYGIEGYFNEELSGSKGFLESERDPGGRMIVIGDSAFEAAIDGADIVLTIDRTIQYTACNLLKKAVIKHSADGGSVVILDPDSGAVLAMCGYPDFNPNDYGSVEDIHVFNNPALFNAYEPGSIFKGLTMAAGLDSGAVTPGTTYEDLGEVEIDDFTIRNSDEKAYGIQTMTQVLEKSLNTGVIFVMRQMGRDVFKNYVENFGFGTYTGVELSEAPGTISSLGLSAEVYPATASYGQGITVTPIQMVAAFGALANGGILMQPYIIDEIRYADGAVKKTSPLAIRRVITERTSRLTGAMLIAVIENGHGTLAAVPGYYLAGKTGTAQVARTDGVGYQTGNTIGSFIGYGPVNDPKFVMITRIDHPRDVQWGGSTAAPLFGEIAEFLLRYFEIPPERSINTP